MRHFAKVINGVPYDNHNLPIEHCIERVSDGGRIVSFHTCGRKLKGDPEFPHLCGLHVAAIHRGRSKEQARQDLNAQRGRELDDFRSRVVKLNEALGIQAIADVTMPTTGPESFIGRPTGKVTVPVAQLEALADQIEKLKSQLAEAEQEMRSERGW